MGCWRKIAVLCVVLIVPAGSSKHCKRREEADWSAFQTAIASSGLQDEDGISNLAADLRTDALSLPVPHTYVIVGGGEWGPRVVAKALLESVYVDWEEEAYLLDMKEARAHLGTLDSGVDNKLEKTWLKEHLCKAIERCPRKAVVVLDNVHLLKGEDIGLLDTMLSLLDGAKTNMDCNDRKVSGERCLFLLLLNEDGPDETRRLPGKERLLKTWEFKGVEFTTKAFVGRIDAAVSLSQEPRLVPDGLKSSWEQARVLPKDGMRHLAASAWKELKAIEERVLRRAKARWDATDRGTLQALGLAAAATMLATCLKLGCFQPAGPLAVPNPVDATETPSEGSGGDSGGGDSRGTAVGSRGGGKTGIPVDREGGGEDADGESDDGSGTGRDEAQERLAPTTRSRARMQSVETGTSAVARTTRGQGKSGSPPRSSRRRRSTVTVKEN